MPGERNNQNLGGTPDIFFRELSESLGVFLSLWTISVTELGPPSPYFAQYRNFHHQRLLSESPSSGLYIPNEQERRPISDTWFSDV